MSKHIPSKAEYETIARLCFAVRRFHRFGENRARSLGMTHQQLQAIIAIHSLSEGGQTTIGDLADQLRIKPHSAVELVDRLELAGFIQRFSSNHDRRRVQVLLTQRGKQVMEEACTHCGPEWIKLGHELQRDLNELIGPETE